MHGWALVSERQILLFTPLSIAGCMKFFCVYAHDRFIFQNLKDQILTTNVWLEHEWQDHKFKWDPSEYGGVTELYVPSEHIWLPDIVLYNKLVNKFRLY